MTAEAIRLAAPSATGNFTSTALDVTGQLVVDQATQQNKAEQAPAVLNSVHPTLRARELRGTLTSPQSKRAAAGLLLARTGPCAPCALW